MPTKTGQETTAGARQCSTEKDDREGGCRKREGGKEKSKRKRKRPRKMD